MKHILSFFDERKVFFFSLIYVYFFTHPTFLTQYIQKYKIKIDHSVQAESKFLIEPWIHQEAKNDKTALFGGFYTLLWILNFDCCRGTSTW